MEWTPCTQNYLGMAGQWICNDAFGYGNTTFESYERCDDDKKARAQCAPALLDAIDYSKVKTPSPRDAAGGWTKCSREYTNGQPAQSVCDAYFGEGRTTYKEYLDCKDVMLGAAQVRCEQKNDSG